MQKNNFKYIVAVAGALNVIWELLLYLTFAGKSDFESLFITLTLIFPYFLYFKQIKKMTDRQAIISGTIIILLPVALACIYSADLIFRISFIDYFIFVTVPQTAAIFLVRLLRK